MTSGPSLLIRPDLGQVDDATYRVWLYEKAGLWEHVITLVTGERRSHVVVQLPDGQFRALSLSEAAELTIPPPQSLENLWPPVPTPTTPTAPSGRPPNGH